MSDNYPKKYNNYKTLLDTSCLLFVLRQELIYLNIRHGMYCFVVSSLYQRHENEIYWMFVSHISATTKSAPVNLYCLAPINFCFYDS